MKYRATIILIAFSASISCKSRAPLSNTREDVTGIKGFIIPGKGFNLAAKDVTAAQCITGYQGDAQNSSNNDNLESTTPNVEPTPPKVETTSTNLTPTINEGNLVDIQIATEHTPKKALALADQSGETTVQFYYLTSIKDVTTAIEASFASSTSGNTPSATGSTEISAYFDAQLSVKFQKSSENVFILMHGRKEFPATRSDAIVDAMFNPRYQNLIFTGDVLPSSESALADSWRRLVQTCGDHYVEYVVRGREIWIVAVMNKTTFESSAGTTVNYSTKSSASLGGLAGVSQEFKGGVKGDISSKLMKQSVDVFMRTRGKNQVEAGKFSLEGALIEMNNFLKTEFSADEGVLSMGIRNYDSVMFQFAQNVTKRGGDIFTRKVRDSVGMNTDVFVKLLAEETWADAESFKIFDDYGWEQWSLIPSMHKGVALQFKALKAYSGKIKKVFSYCGGRSADINTVSAECLQAANTAAANRRPIVDLPEINSHSIALWMPPDVIAAADLANWGAGAGEVEFTVAKNICNATPGWTIPGAADWHRALEASYFYAKWQKDQDPGYKLDEDTEHLAYPCGRFSGAIFWSDHADKVVEINQSCNADLIKDKLVPDSQKYMNWVLWTKNKARFACVNYKKN